MSHLSASRAAACWITATLILGTLMGCSSTFAPINDITTDLAKPPPFFVKPPERGDYDAGRYRALQEKYYPALHNLEAEWPLDEAYARVLNLVRERGWTIVGIEEPRRRVQVVCVTAILRFRDDVVIEVRAPAAPSATVRSVIAMRSKSRVGTLDFGTNAGRIREFLRELREGR